MEVRHKRLRRRKLVDLNELFTSKGSNKVHQNFGATTRPQYPRFNWTPLYLFSIIAESYIEILRCQLHYTYFLSFRPSAFTTHSTRFVLASSSPSLGFAKLPFLGAELHL